MKVNLNRRQFLKAAALGTAAIIIPGCAVSSRKVFRNLSGSRPNIVIIMADDMGYSDIGCYGGEIDTPNLDRLAKKGVRFTHFYNTARCCPTRASLLTGLYPHQAGVGHMTEDTPFPGYQGGLSNRSVTIAEVMKQSGYSTYAVGKWHVTKHLDKPKDNWPCQRGFDHFYGTIIGAGSYYNPATLTRDNTRIQVESEDYYYTDAISNNAINFISKHFENSANKPFFMYVAYTCPHWPLHALPEDIAKYKGRYDIGWDEVRRKRHERMIKMGIVDEKWELTPLDEQAESWEEVEDKTWRARCMEVYAGQVDRMDQGIGRIIEALKKEGKFDNTLILFLADNGGCAEEIGPGWGPNLVTPEYTRDKRKVIPGNISTVMPGAANTYQSYGLPWANASNTPFRLYKHWVHEGGIASPLMAHWPKGIINPGRLTDESAHVIDLMATCCDLGNAKYPKAYKGNDIIPLEGKSLVPILYNKKRDGHDAIFWEHEGNRAVRKGKWKLVSKFPGKWELYNLEVDRTELSDLAGEHPTIVKELSSMYYEWANRSFVKRWEDLLEMRRQMISERQKS